MNKYFKEYLKRGMAFGGFGPIIGGIVYLILSIYVAYVGCYLINSWIPFEPTVVAIFTAIFIVTYFIIWIAVYLSIKAVSKKLNKRIG